MIYTTFLTENLNIVDLLACFVVTRHSILCDNVPHYDEFPPPPTHTQTRNNAENVQ